MFGLLKAKNPYSVSAKKVYGRLLTHIRHEEFYSKYSVPDTLDGRFDLLLLHCYAVIEFMLAHDVNGRAEKFNQALFDAVFADMDQSLREIGIGDMGIPKHMRRMMKAFNGRMHAYRTAEEGESFEGALRQNLFGTVDAPEDNDIRGVAQYSLSLHAFIEEHNSFEKVLNGELELPDANSEDLNNE
ncbi:MAG: ubiquinol-cytochrome C chaperone family protein [Micavibrio sp.]|nr:ubiquinol-cytochrome C chaperone family protein [Micavibrio sp.]